MFKNIPAILNRSAVAILVVDKLGSVTWANHGLLNVSVEQLRREGIGLLDSYLKPSDRLIQAQELDAAINGKGNVRNWELAFRFPDIGERYLAIRAWSIDSDNLVIEFSDKSELHALKLQAEEVTQELHLFTKMLRLRGRNLPEDQFYYLLLKMLISNTGADEAVLYIKPDRLHNQLVAAVAAESSSIDVSQFDLSRDSSHQRVELTRLIPDQSNRTWAKVYQAGHRSILQIPLRGKTEYGGSLVLLSKRPEHFDWKIIRLLTHVSNFIHQLVMLDILRWQSEHSASISAAVFSSVESGLVVIDYAGRINEANPKAAKLLDFTNDTKKPHLSDLTVPGYQETILRFLDRLRAKGRARCRAKLNADIDHTYEFEGNIIAGGHKQIYLCSIRDVSEWVNRQELLHQKTIRLEQLDQLKTQFISMVSHELRSPLTVIQGHLSLWEADQRAVDQDSMRAMREGVERLNRFVDDILLATQMEYNSLPLVYEEIRLDQYLLSLVNQLQPLIKAKQLTIELQLKPFVIKSDRDRLSQVLMNILVNAIKYCASGDKISMSTRRSGPNIFVKISDTGPGIEKAHLPHIFDRFYKANFTSNGAGLGLYIADQLTKRMGGRLKVQSGVGRGTSFTIYLPTAVNSKQNK